MKTVLTFVLFLTVSSNVFSQAVKPVKQPVTPAPSTTTTPVVQYPNTTTAKDGPQGTVLTPAPIELGKNKIPGDSEVLAIIGDINYINTQYDKGLKDLNDKWVGPWNTDQQKMQEAVQKVKDANGWGDDVIFYNPTKQWIKLTKEELENTKKVQVNKPATTNSK